MATCAYYYIPCKEYNEVFGQIELSFRWLNLCESWHSEMIASKLKWNKSSKVKTNFK